MGITVGGRYGSLLIYLQQHMCFSFCSVRVHSGVPSRVLLEEGGVAALRIEQLWEGGGPPFAFLKKQLKKIIRVASEVELVVYQWVIEYTYTNKTQFRDGAILYYQEKVI